MLNAMQQRGTRCAARQGGFTLLEVLVAVLIFGVGLLTVASLQVVAKRANYEAVQRTTASHLAFDLMERMRANATGLDFYTTAGGFIELGRGSRGAEPAPDCDSAADGCTSADLAVHDLWAWEQLLDGAAEMSAGAATGGLVSPTACVQAPAAGAGAPGIYTVAIAWRGTSELTNPAGNNCGEATGLYGANNEFRRLLVIQTFISPI